MPRKPLSVSTKQQLPLSNILVDTFNDSQHVTTCDTALNQLKKTYLTASFNEQQFVSCFRKLLQSTHNNYFKSSCEFVVKFLLYVSKVTETTERAAENRREKPKPRPKRASKRKAQNYDEDELLGMNNEASNNNPRRSSVRQIIVTVQPTQESESITSHDLFISSVIDVAILYTQSINDECRLNAVYFILKLLSHFDTLDEEICTALKSILPKRIRDKKPVIRAHAVVASKIFQEAKLIKEAFVHHFQRDPELVVRKALLQIMSTEIFGYDFLIESTQDTHAPMRKSAYQRIGKLSPLSLTLEQRHRVIHNGINERDRQASYVFKSQTLEPWLLQLYKNNDIYGLLKNFDVINYQEDIVRLLDIIYHKELDLMDSSSSSTKLHRLVESFRDKFLKSDLPCIPNVIELDEFNLTTWFSLINFCRSNQSIIQQVKLQVAQPDKETIEKIFDSSQKEDELIDLYERLCPDLVCVAEFLKLLVEHLRTLIQASDNPDIAKFEFMYQKVIDFVLSCEVGDELERKTTQEALGYLLQDDILPGKFENYIVPIIKCLSKLVYHSSSNLMIGYISELINNVRSHLEDIDMEQNQSEGTQTVRFQVDAEQIDVFRNKPHELIKCLQMYVGCLQNVQLTEIPETLMTHMMHLTLEGMQAWFEDNVKIRSLVMTCTGLTALVNKNYAIDSSTIALLVSGCNDKLIEVKAISFQGLVDVLCQHDLEIDEKVICRFLGASLCEYGKFDPKAIKPNEYNFVKAIIEGAAKLFYFSKISSPQIFSHFILWWYHPRTPSKLKQFIGIFLPMFVDDHMRRPRKGLNWLPTLLEDTFILSIEYLHNYILGQGFNIMGGSDINCLINFLIYLIPITSHGRLTELLDDALQKRTKEKKSSSLDLCHYFKMAKNLLTTQSNMAGKMALDKQV